MAFLQSYWRQQFDASGKISIGLSGLNRIMREMSLDISFM